MKAWADSRRNFGVICASQWNWWRNVSTPRYQAPLVMEGGALHVDGEGTALVTEECLLNPNRNPQLTRAAIERGLCEYLGVRRIIWLGRGVVNDETSGHVDNLACFVRRGEVCLTWTDRRRDPQQLRRR